MTIRIYLLILLLLVVKEDSAQGFNAVFSKSKSHLVRTQHYFVMNKEQFGERIETTKKLLDYIVVCW